MNSFLAEAIQIFTDGACLGNPGPGGWGVLLIKGSTQKQLSGAEADTTNNRMELTAAIKGLQALNKKSKVILTTDSQYVRLGMTTWLVNWQKRGWRKADNKPVKNADLWKELLAAAKEHDVQWRWVKGHSGVKENEIVDSLANQAARSLVEN